MKNMRVYQCEDSINGIFTAIYEAGMSGYGHQFIKIQERSKSVNNYEMELFTEYIAVESDTEKASKVLKSIRDNIQHTAKARAWRSREETPAERLGKYQLPISGK